jgi:hypothetical protein
MSCTDKRADIVYLRKPSFGVCWKEKWRGKTMSSEVILYVRSAKTATGEEQVGGYKEGVTAGVPTKYGPVGSRPYSYCDLKTVVEYDYVLSEDQQRMVEDVKELASRYGFVLTVVDLAKDSAFSRWRIEHSNKIKTLPALETDSGEIMEGVMTREQIEAFLYKAGKSATRT